MPFRLVDQAPQYFILTGLKVLAGGSLTFYGSGTSVLKDTYTDPTLAATNLNPMVINADGRIGDVWMNGNYRVVCADSLGVAQWTRDNVQGPADLPAQAGKAGDFLTTDGSALSWGAITQTPDPTGQSGKYLTNNGVNLMWTAPPSTITGSKTSLILGSVKIQTGSGSAVISGTNTAGASVTYPEAFSGTAVVMAQVNLVSGLTDHGGIGVSSVTAMSSTGFNFTITDNDYGSNTSGIVVPIPFSWFAIGPA